MSSLRFFKYTFTAGILASILTVCGQTSSSEPEKLGVYEKLDTVLSDQLIFVDENYDTVSLVEAIDRPTILVMVYYECPGICSPLLNGVADAMDKARMELGSDYQVFTISFDHGEKPHLAQKKKKTYSKLVSHGNKDYWRFFTGDSANVYALLNNIGYMIKREGKEYIHPATIVALSPNAKVTRYLHGTYFLPFDLKMAVVEASEGRSGATINKVLQYCFSYDPEGQKYVFNITKVSGSIILIIALAFLGSLLYKNRKDKKIKTLH